MKGRQNDFVVTIIATEAISKNAMVTVDGKHTAAAHAVGVALFDTDSGDPISVSVGPIQAVKAGAALSAGAELETDASGRVVTLSSGKLVGVALDAAAAANDIIRVLQK